MNAKLLRRRETLLKHMTKGVSLQAAAEEMTKNITDASARRKQINAIRRDWANRKHWIDNIVRLSDSTILHELIAGLEEVAARAWVEYYRTDDPKVKIQALHVVVEAKTRESQILMKVGIIKEAPQKVDSTMMIAETPFESDPELRKALLEATERQRQEKKMQDAKPSV